MIILQLFGKDTLLNFKQPDARILGTVGNDMMQSSFVCVLAPFLIINPLNWIPLWLIAFISKSTGAVLALGLGSATLLWAKVKRARIAIIALFIGILLYTGMSGDIKTFFGKAGRGPVWAKTCELVAKNPLGHGIATYKVLFPYMCGAEIARQQPGREWNTAHNDFLQIPFEVGIPGLILLFGWIISILRKLKDPLKIAGLMILSGVMLVHFPMRLNQTVLVMIMFLAYLEGEPCNTSS
jgi:O-antigen ligase